MFTNKKYILLPEIKVKFKDSENFENLTIDYLKSRALMPEALINEAYLLGFSKGHQKEYSELMKGNKDVDVIDFHKILYEVI